MKLTYIFCLFISCLHWFMPFSLGFIRFCCISFAFFYSFFISISCRFYQCSVSWERYIATICHRNTLFPYVSLFLWSSFVYWVCGRLYDLFNTRLIINLNYDIFVFCWFANKYVYYFSLKSLLLLNAILIFGEIILSLIFCINRQKNEAEYMFLLDALGDWYVAHEPKALLQND